MARLEARRGSPSRPEHHFPFPFFYRILHAGPSTPEAVANLVNGLRHTNGKVNHEHPAIEHIMKEANKNRLDVGLIPQGLHTIIVWGKNLVNEKDRKKVVKVAAGAAITTATVAGATMIALRIHKRTSKGKE